MCRILLQFTLFILLATAVSGLAASTVETPQTAADSSELATALTTELTAFRPLAEEALMLRAETIKVGKRILADQQAGVVLTGADLALLNEGLAQHLALRDRLMAVAEARKGWLDMGAAQLARAGITPEMRREGVAL